MRNRILIVVVILGLAAFAANANGKSESTGYSASIAYIEGQATIDGRTASTGDTVPLGSTVATDAQSLCEIRFNGKNAIRLAESTAFVFDPANLQRGSELKQGALIMVLKNLTTGADGQGFKLRTPSALAGVRGTSFFVKVVDASATYVCCCNGAVHVEDNAGALRMTSCRPTTRRSSISQPRRESASPTRRCSITPTPIWRRSPPTLVSPSTGPWPNTESPRLSA